MSMKDAIFGTAAPTSHGGATYRDSIQAWLPVKNIIGGVLITKDIQLAGDGEVDPNLIKLGLNTTAWTLGTDGYYYYNKALKPGETTAPILSSVTFEPTMGNEYQNAAATVDISAQAVQTANNGTSALTASGWPAA